MIAIIILVIIMTISVAAINLKLPQGRADKWVRLPVLVTIISFNTIVAFHGYFLTIPVLRLDSIIGLSMAFILVMPLYFIASSYIRHLMDKTDIDVAKKLLGTWLLLM